MTWVALLLLAGLDAWTVPAGTKEIALSSLPQWIEQAKPSIPTNQRNSIHLGPGILLYFIKTEEATGFLSDKNPLAHYSRRDVRFPVLDGDQRTIGSISVMVFDDQRGSKTGVFIWGERAFPFGDVEDTNELPGVKRILGMATWDSCSYERVVAYVDAGDKVSLRSSAGTIDWVRSYDVVVLGTLTSVTENAITIGERDILGPGRPQIKAYNKGEIDVERVLKGEWASKKVYFCFPSDKHSVGEFKLYCPPSVQPGDRRIWLLNLQFVRLIPALVENDGCAIDVKYLNQVEREIERINASSKRN